MLTIGSACSSTERALRRLSARLDELVLHFQQKPGFDGRPRRAPFEQAIADPSFARAPYMLVVDLATSTVTPALPTSLLGRPSGGDGTARGGYGRPIFKRDGFRCRYCGFDLGGTYRGWLQLSVDHVVPAQTKTRQQDPFPAEYVDDAANLVTCCRSCNDLGNRWTVNDRAPTSELAFLDVRDRVFLQRRARLALRQREAEAQYRRLVPPDVIGRTWGPRVKKKLIEVALPLEAINVASAREKSIRHGHPSTLHLWWARRPLAACRAVLFASLVDDPSSDPERFPTLKAQEDERTPALRDHRASWSSGRTAPTRRVLEDARAEILRSTGGNPPPVLDPFCGGGSIPLEAQRLGLTAYASDLNPVAVLITKALIEIPPRFADVPPVHPDARRGVGGTGAWKGAAGLAEDVRRYGAWMRDEAERRIGHLYPKVRLPKEQGGGEATVIAWLWARTVTCPNPACGAQMPLVQSFALSTKKGQGGLGRADRRPRREDGPLRGAGGHGDATRSRRKSAVGPASGASSANR